MEKVKEYLNRGQVQSISDKRGKEELKKKLAQEDRQKQNYRLEQYEFKPEFAKFFKVVPNLTNIRNLKATAVLTVDDGFITVYNNQYISEQQLVFISPAIQELFNIASPANLTYKPIKTTVDGGIYLPDPSQLQTLLECLHTKLSTGGKFRFESSQDIKLWLLMFGLYETFMTGYVAYCSDPDDGIKIKLTDDINTDINATFDHYYRPKFQNDTYKKTLEDIKAFVHLVILDMNRNLSQSDNQLENTINSRINAFKYSVHCPFEIHLPVENEFFTTLQSTLDMYPKLKAAMWNTCNILNTSYPELPLAYQLTEYAGMIHIKLAYEFITMGERTLAHRDPRMWSEMSAFYSTYSDILSSLGEQDIKYYRFLMPEDRRLVMSKFGNLYNAAHVYFAQNNDTLKNITSKVKPSIRDLEYFAKTLDTEAATYYDNLDLDSTARGIVTDPVKLFVKNTLKVKEEKVDEIPDYNKFRETEDFRAYKQDKANQILSRPQRIGFRSVLNVNAPVNQIPSINNELAGAIAAIVTETSVF